jgi:hypothetical protein
MNTGSTETGVQQYSSPLRITSEAVQLRDVTYPLAAIKSAGISGAATDEGFWSYGLLVFDVGGSLQVGTLAAELRVWEMRASGQDMAYLLAVAGAYLAIAYLLRWLYARSRKKWQYVYAAELDTDYGKTLIAASLDKTYIEQIVANVSAALARHGGGTPFNAVEGPGATPASSNAASEEAGAAQEGVVYDNYFRIDGSHVSVPGWSTAISEVRHASKKKLEARSLDQRRSPWDPVACLALGVILKTQNELFGPDLLFYILAGLVIVAAILLFVVWWTTGRDKPKTSLPTFDQIYVGKLIAGGRDVPTLISIDQGFVDQFISSVKEAVSNHKASTGRSPSATRSSPGPT